MATKSSFIITRHLGPPDDFAEQVQQLKEAFAAEVLGVARDSSVPDLPPAAYQRQLDGILRCVQARITTLNSHAWHVDLSLTTNA